jgi:hypothetical protein
MLPLNMISKRDFGYMINNVKANISATGLYLIKTNYQDIVQMRRYIATRSYSSPINHNILLTIPLPIALSQSYFTLYKILKLSMPVDPPNSATSHHSSIIRNLPNYVAFNSAEDVPWILEFQQRPRTEQDLWS